MTRSEICISLLTRVLLSVPLSFPKADVGNLRNMSPNIPAQALTNNVEDIESVSAQHSPGQQPHASNQSCHSLTGSVYNSALKAAIEHGSRIAAAKFPVMCFHSYRYTPAHAHTTWLQAHYNPSVRSGCYAYNTKQCALFE